MFKCISQESAINEDVFDLASNRIIMLIEEKFVLVNEVVSLFRCTYDFYEIEPDDLRKCTMDLDLKLRPSRNEEIQQDVDGNELYHEALVFKEIFSGAAATNEPINIMKKIVLLIFNASSEIGTIECQVHYFDTFSTTSMYLNSDDDMLRSLSFMTSLLHLLMELFELDLQNKIVAAGQAKRESLGDLNDIVEYYHLILTKSLQSTTETPLLNHVPVQMESSNLSVVAFIVREIEVIGKGLLLSWEPTNKDNKIDERYSTVKESENEVWLDKEARTNEHMKPAEKKSNNFAVTLARLTPSNRATSNEKRRILAGQDHRITMRQSVTTHIGTDGQEGVDRGLLGGQIRHLLTV
nr:unnamed protein product [Callosobruchus chinensis]